MSDLIRREDALRVTLAYSSSYSAEQAETAIRALPAVQPDPREAALRDIARQKKTDEMDTEYDVEYADFEGGYNAIIDVARRALPAVQPGHVNETPKSEHDERVMLTLTAERDQLLKLLEAIIDEYNDQVHGPILHSIVAARTELEPKP